MVAFTKLQSLAETGNGFLTGVTGMLALPDGIGGTMLYTATARGGGLTAWRITSSGMLALAGQEAYSASSASLASTTLTSVQVLGRPALLPIGVYDSQLTPYGLSSSGALTGSKAGLLSADAALPSATAHAVATTIGTESFVYSAHAGVAGPDAYRISGNTALTALAPVSGGVDGTVTSLAVADTGGTKVLLAGFTGDDRITSYTIGASGAMTRAGTAGAPQGVALSSPDAIATAEVGGHSFAVVASAGSGTLTVLQVGPDGSLTATDQVLDDLSTRFANADLVTTVSQGGHEFVLAAGSDDGMSLFALTAGGRLEHLSTIADATDTTLAHAGALTAVANGSALDVYVTSTTEPGLTAYSVDLSRFGSILEGGAGTRLVGTSRDDILIAHSGNDSLMGGAGADLFAFDPAGAVGGKLGTVVDFTPGTDRLDLSSLPLLHDASQVTVASTATGAILHYGQYWVEVNAALPGPLTSAAFTTANLLNVTHQPVGDTAGAYSANDAMSTPSPVTINTGGSGAHTITGAGGSDSLTGGSGDDTIAGLDGNDTIHAADGADHVLGGAGSDLIYGGATSADGADYIDAGEGQNTAAGGAGNDTLLAGSGDDLLWGGEGNDSINGGDGQNTLRGGDGGDTITGGSGGDLIYGGDSSNDLRDVIYGGGGNDTVDAGYGNDSVSGGTGNDTIDGGFGTDTLIGNDGADTLSGGPLADLLVGGPGNDYLNGGFGSDRLNGGGGADRFFHQGTASFGSDWIQDFRSTDGDVLVFGDPAARASQFQVNHAATAGAGNPGVQEAFVIYKPTGQIIWALVDGAGQHHIELQIAGSPTLHDLLV